MRAASAPSEGLPRIWPSDYNHGVGSENAIMRTLSRNRQRLLARQTFGTILCGFSGQLIFRDMRGLHFESDACVTQ